MTLRKTLLLASVCLPSLALAQTCATTSLTGPYAYSGSGNVTTAGTAAIPSHTITNSEVGTMLIDGKGNLTGYTARTINGVTAVGTFIGTYEIFADCTATGRAIYSDGSIAFDMVIVNNGSDFAFVLRDPAFTVSGTGTKIESQGACTPATLAGSYGYQGDGTVSAEGRNITLAEIGIQTFDGKGGVSGIYSAVAGGVAERRTYTGIYELGENCTGNLKFSIGDANYLTNFVVANKAFTILYSEVGPNTVITGQGVATFVK